MRDVDGGGERLTTARMCPRFVFACFASVCRCQWVSTAGRVVARLLLVGLVLCVAMVASELIGARAVCGRTAWECARCDGGT